MNKIKIETEIKKLKAGDIVNFDGVDYEII